MDLSQKKPVSIILTCIDYRFTPEAQVLLEQSCGEADIISIAGGAKNLASPSHEGDKHAVLESIKIAVDLHQARRIILTNHIDCGAYGGSSKFASIDEERAFHHGELRKASSAVIQVFPTLNIIRAIVSKDQDGRVELELVR